MKNVAIFMAGLALTTPAVAEVSELSQADLRAAVAQDRAMPTRSLIAGVENFTGGTVVDLRAFFQEGDVVFRILYQNDSGEIETLLVDGGTGRAVNVASNQGQSVLAYVAANPSAGNGHAYGRDRNSVGNGRNNGNNAGGNGRGNSGGGGNGRNN